MRLECIAVPGTMRPQKRSLGGRRNGDESKIRDKLCPGSMLSPKF